MKTLMLMSTVLLTTPAWSQVTNPNNPFGQPTQSTTQQQPSTYTAPKNVGSGGVELSEIPIAVSSKCDSVVLKGTKSYNNTAFLMPKAKVAKDEYNEYLMEVVPL